MLNGIFLSRKAIWKAFPDTWKGKKGRSTDQSVIYGVIAYVHSYNRYSIKKHHPPTVENCNVAIGTVICWMIRWNFWDFVNNKCTLCILIVTLLHNYLQVIAEIIVYKKENHNKVWHTFQNSTLHDVCTLDPEELSVRTFFNWHRLALFWIREAAASIM